MSGVTAIAAGPFCTAALKDDGSVVVWGDNRFGQTDGPVAARSGVTAIAAGDYHTVALKHDGSVVAWGYNEDGRTTVPAGLSRVTAIAAGGDYTLALLGTALPRLSLHAQPNGNELNLTWSTNAVGITLQCTLNLTPPVTWIDSTLSPAVNGAQFTVPNSATESARFYRLKKP